MQAAVCPAIINLYDAPACHSCGFLRGLREFFGFFWFPFKCALLTLKPRLHHRRPVATFKKQRKCDFVLSRLIPR